MTTEHRPPMRRHSFIDPHNIVYATIILLVAMDVLQFRAEEGDGVSLPEFLVLTIGPLVMVAVAHSFAGAIEIQVRQRRRLVATDYRRLGVTVLQYVSVALVPCLIAIGFSASGGEPISAAAVTEVLGLISLLLWGYYAGWASGRGQLGRIGNSVLYGFVGLVIILLELAVTH
jgi:hypothetical protein